MAPKAHAERMHRAIPRLCDDDGMARATSCGRPDGASRRRSGTRGRRWRRRLRGQRSKRTCPHCRTYVLLPLAFVACTSHSFPLEVTTMTLQQLEYFLAALDEGSFTAAAERLLLAQPSLSEQIRRL